MAAQRASPAGLCAVGHAISGVPSALRFARFQAFGSGLDPTEIEEARTWFRTFDGHNLPKGATTYSRSSGAGGQHVNK